MKILNLIFGKKYLEWNEYQEKIKTLDKKMFRKEVEEENKKIDDLNLSS